MMLPSKLRVTTLVFLVLTGAGLIWTRTTPARLLGLFPATIERRRYGIGPAVLVGWTHPYGPLGTPLVDGDAAEAVTGAWLDHVAASEQLPGLMLLPFLPTDGALAHALDRALAHRGGASALFAPHVVWQIAHGETPDNIKNHPALKGVTIPKTGRNGRIGTLVTKTLLVAGEGGFFTTPNGQRGAMLRAYDKATGNEVGSVYMPAPQSGTPMTYMLNGRQYIVIAVSGGNYSGEYIAFRLPEADAESGTR